MPRKRINYTPETIVHVTDRLVRRETYPLPLEKIWKIYEDYLFFLSHAFQIQIYAFVLMNNHFHLLLRAPLVNLGSAMNHFLRESSKEINRMTGRMNQNYGSRFYPSEITGEHHLALVFRYIYQNPLRAGICSTILDYPFSTVGVLYGRTHSVIPIHVDAFSEDLHFNEKNLDWLNRSPCVEETELIKTSMTKRIFKIKRDRKSGHAVNVLSPYA